MIPNTYPVEEHVRIAAQMPQHAELMRAIAKPHSEWRKGNRLVPKG